MNQVNITFFDLPLLAAPGGVAFGIWDPWTDYALAFYGTQVPFTSGGYGFSGTWYASPSYDGVIAQEDFGTVAYASAGTIGKELASDYFSASDIGFDGTWYAPEFANAGSAALAGFDTNTLSSGTVGAVTDAGSLHGGYDYLVYGEWDPGWSTVEDARPQPGTGTNAMLLMLDSGSSFSSGTQGQVIDSWPDVSGQGHHFVPFTGNNGPTVDLTNALNGHPVIKFAPGTAASPLTTPGDALGCASFGVDDDVQRFGGEIFVVARCTSNSPANYQDGAMVQFTQFSSQNSTHHPWSGDGAFYENMLLDLREATAIPTTNLANWFVYNVRHSGGYWWRATLNGTEQLDQLTGSKDPLISAASGTYYIGTGWDNAGSSFLKWEGWMAHVRYYDRYLTDAERSGVIGELQARFGI